MHQLVRFLSKLIKLPLNLWKALKLADADIYYYRNPDYLSGIMAIFCKLNKKKYVIAGANNWNFNKGKERNLNNINALILPHLHYSYLTITKVL